MKDEQYDIRYRLPVRTTPREPLWPRLQAWVLRWFSQWDDEELLYEYWDEERARMLRHENMHITKKEK